MTREVDQSEALIDPALLHVLLHADGPRSVEALALERGVTQRQVLSEIEQLRRVGCAFDTHPQHGLRLAEAGLGAWTDYLRHALGDDRLIEVYQRTASTQDTARRLITTHGARSDGAIVTAGEQTGGRGRFGRPWVTPAGTAVTFSRVTWPANGEQDGAATVDRITFAVSVAVASVAEQLLAGRGAVRIKWPNDVCVDGRKLVGILVETVEAARGRRAAIIGVGFNVALRPEHLPTDDPQLLQRVTSLAMHGVEVDRLRMLAQLAQAIDAALVRRDTDELLAQWRQRSAQLNQLIRVRSDGQPIEGHVIDLDPHAGLIVRTATGEIVHLPAATTTVEK